PGETGEGLTLDDDLRGAVPAERFRDVADDLLPGRGDGGTARVEVHGEDARGLGLGPRWRLLRAGRERYRECHQHDPAHVYPLVRNDGHACNAFHISMSRSAVQIRGSAMPLISS